MKIGIISMHRVVNYGSFLQAYGLKKVLEELGNTCHFIDILDEDHSFNYYNIYEPKLYFIKSIYRKIKMPIEKRLFLEREYLFKHQLLKYLDLKKEYSADYKCDAVVIGSDEIFNCCQKSSWGKTMHLFGEGVPQSSLLISYAASFGFTTKELLLENNLYDTVKNKLLSFKAISVRDENSSNIIREMIGEEPYKNIDPVLLYDFKDVIPQKHKFKNYIVIYGYDNRINEENLIREIQEFAKINNLTTIALGMQQNWCDINYLPNPFELLAIIRDANYIVTDTFHGTIFSIKFQKKFATIIRDSNNQKLSDLLKLFNLEDREIRYGEKIANILDQTYNTTEVKNKIECERQKSLNYLKINLKKNDR